MSHTITHVGDKVREWNSNAGKPFKSYRVTLTNPDGGTIENVELSRPATSPAPAVGEKVEGTLDTSGQYGPKFKEARQGGPGGRSKPPEERRSIAMQHAQKCAVTVLELAAEHSEYKPTSANDVVQQVKAVAWVLFGQVMDAESGRRVDGPARTARSDVPEPAAGEFVHPQERPMDVIA